MSDTPRTDEDEDRCANCGITFASVEHARQLERDLAAANAKLEYAAKYQFSFELAKELDDLRAKLAEANTRAAKLEDADRICAEVSQDNTQLRALLGDYKVKLAEAHAEKNVLLADVASVKDDFDTAIEQRDTALRDLAAANAKVESITTIAERAEHRASQLESDNADLRAKLAEAQEEYDSNRKIIKELSREHIKVVAERENFHRERDEARRDSERLDWAMPILDGEGGKQDERTARVAFALIQGLTGRAMLDVAMERTALAERKDRT